jgi:peptidyl-prolyl cis-trans isomerase A (cyclophilin A)
MSSFQEKLEEQKRKQEQVRMQAMAEFMVFVQKTYPTATGTASGLHYIVEHEGSGPKPNKFQEVQVHYTGSLADGTVFDSSVARGTPIAFPIGAGRVIAGWDEGIALLQQRVKSQVDYSLLFGLWRAREAACYSG